MTRKLFNGEGGYSLVEVMVSIMLLTIAIIPMVGMFDAGLRSATVGSNYDKARTFANKQLERTKSLTYEQVRDDYPSNVTDASLMTGGTYNNSASPIDSAAAPHEVPGGFSYSVRKQYKSVPTGGGPVNLTNSTTDTGLIEVTVTVRWGTSNSYSVTGLEAQ